MRRIYVHVLERRNENVAQADDLGCVSIVSRCSFSMTAHIFMPQVLEEFEFAVCAFRQNRGAEGFHNLLHSDGLAGQLVSRGALRHRWSVSQISIALTGDDGKLPDKTKSAHSHRLEIRVSGGELAAVSFLPSFPPPLFISPPSFHNINSERKEKSYRLVISKVVPKIWARTNSAILGGQSSRLSRTSRPRLNTKTRARAGAVDARNERRDLDLSAGYNATESEREVRSKSERVCKHSQQHVVGEEKWRGCANLWLAGRSRKWAGGRRRQMPDCSTGHLDTFLLAYDLSIRYN
jgi:hypothetical protein